VVGVDRGVAVSAALSTGELLQTPTLTPGERMRLRRLQQRLVRAKRGSNRRARTRLAIARLKAREADRRRDWLEKTTTDLAHRFDTIRVEDLDVRAMTRSARGTLDQPGVRVAQKRGLNRAIRHQAGVSWSPGSTIRPRADSNGSRPRTRRNDASPVGTSHLKTARAKRSSRASPAAPGRATPM
jgi:putative transposase